MEEKKKVVALLSGGLDSRLAVKMMQNQGFDVTAVAIKTPFCDFDCGRGCGFEIRETADMLGVDLRTVYLGDEYIEMLKHPKYGFGSGMNPCIDCRAMMFRAGKKVMEEIGGEFKRRCVTVTVGQSPDRARKNSQVHRVALESPMPAQGGQRPEGAHGKSGDDERPGRFSLQPPVPLRVCRPCKTDG